MKTNNKPVLYTIIVLLFLFSFLSYYGTNRRLNPDLNVGTSDTPLNSGILSLGDSEYVCESDSCGYVSSFDETMDINYPSGSLNFYPYINDTYTFIKDGSNILLFNMQTETVEIDGLEAIKFYGELTSNNTILVKKDGLWGVLSLNSLNMNIDFMYEELGLSNKLDDGKLEANYYIAKDSDGYFIYDAAFNEKRTFGIEYPIYDYNNKYVVIKNPNNLYDVLDYTFNSYLSFITISKVALTDNYVGAITTSNKVFVYDNSLGSYLFTKDVNENSTISMTEEAGVLTVYIDDEVVYTSN